MASPEKQQFIADSIHYWNPGKTQAWQDMQVDLVIDRREAIQVPEIGQGYVIRLENAAARGWLAGHVRHGGKPIPVLGNHLAASILEFQQHGDVVNVRAGQRRALRLGERRRRHQKRQRQGDRESLGHWAIVIGNQNPEPPEPALTHEP